MGNSKVITFILVGNRDGELIEEIYSTSSNLLNHGNAVILREPEQFINLYHSLARGAEFRLLIHLGLHNGNDVGTKISSAITDELNIIPEYFTRESPIFSQEENKSFIMYGDKTVYNFDFMNRKSFIDGLPKHIKGEFLNKASIKSGTNCSKYKIFIGSSTPGFDYAKAVKKIIDESQNYEGVVWKDVFGDDNTTTIEKLEETIEKYMYSIFVFSPDDKIKFANDDSEQKTPRDNVIFEYGLFMGKGGRSNTFLMVPQDSNKKSLVHILTDINGLNYKPYTYSGSGEANIKSDVRNACDDIINSIKRLN